MKELTNSIWVFDDHDEYGITYACSNCGRLIIVSSKQSIKPATCPYCNNRMRSTSD